MSALIFPCSVAGPFSGLVAKFSHYKYLTRKDCQTYLTLFKIGLFGVTHWRGAGGGVSRGLSPLEFSWYQHFFTRNQQIVVISRNTKKDWVLNSSSSNFFEFFKAFLINMVAILMMSAKLATLSFLKINAFWNKTYDVTIFVHDVTMRVLALNSNCTVDWLCDRCLVTLPFLWENL